MMLDEPSLGQARLTTVLLIAQAHRGEYRFYWWNRTRIRRLPSPIAPMCWNSAVMEGAPEQLRADPSLRDAYLGAGERRKLGMG
jgi:hypothetical protein